MTKPGLMMRYSSSVFILILYIVTVFPLAGCNKNSSSDSGTVPSPPTNVNNNPPGLFTITLANISWDTATIQWTKAVDPDNDPVYYKIYLNDTVRTEHYTALQYTFKDLKGLTDYRVKIIASDTKQKETTSVLNFTTKKYFLKYLKKVDYGIPSTYTSKRTGQMIKANDGGYIIAGNVELADWPNPPFKLCTVKIDSLGNKTWEKHYDYTAGDFKIKIVNNQNNGYIISGAHHIIRISNNGDFIWRQTISPKTHMINSVAVHSDGSIYAAGLIASDSSQNEVEAVLVKLDQNGNLLWKKTYSPTARDEFHDIKIYNNEIVVLGLTNAGNSHFRVYQLTLDGNIIWNKEYYDPWGIVFPESIIKTREGNYVFTGYYVGNNQIPYFYLQMIEANGHDIWTYYSDDNPTKAYSVAETNDNALIVTGGYQFSYSAQAALYKFEKNGNKLWQKLYEEFDTYLFNKTVIPTEDGGYIMNAQKSKAYNASGETDQIYIFKTDDKGEFN